MKADNVLAMFDATEQARMVREGEVSPAELVDEAIYRIEKLNPSLNAVIWERFEKARKEAVGDLPDAPFRGVPILVKDLEPMEGERSALGNKFLRDQNWIDNHDAYSVAKLRAAGFIPVGKTNAPEFGLTPTTEPLAFGPTHNPHNPAYSPGGSSGGSAAAIAAGMVAAASASDGGGSIRIPASMCGLVGLKSTRGRVSLGPDWGDSWGGLVVRGALGRTVRDTAGLLDVMRGEMPGDPHVAPEPTRSFASEVGVEPRQLRIGIRMKAPAEICEVEPECARAVEKAAMLLESQGHVVEEADIAALDVPDAGTAFMCVFWSAVAAGVYELGKVLGQEFTADDVEPLTWAYAQEGSKFTSTQVMVALHAFGTWTRKAAAWWEDHDLLLTPTMARVPPKLGELVASKETALVDGMKNTPYGIFTLPWNITGQPAISLPLHVTTGEQPDAPAGLPVGTQLTATFGREDLLIQIASQLEDQFTPLPNSPG